MPSMKYLILYCYRRLLYTAALNNFVVSVGMGDHETESDFPLDVGHLLCDCVHWTFVGKELGQMLHVGSGHFTF